MFLRINDITIFLKLGLDDKIVKILEYVHIQFLIHVVKKEYLYSILSV